MEAWELWVCLTGTYFTPHVSSIWQFQSYIHYNKTAVVRIRGKKHHHHLFKNQIITFLYSKPSDGFLSLLG